LVPFEYNLVLAMIVFSLGLIGVLFRRNLLFVLMSIELMLNAVNLVFVSASTYLGDSSGQIMVVFIIMTAVCEAAVGLSMVVTLFKQYRTIKSDFYRVLRG